MDFKNIVKTVLSEKTARLVEARLCPDQYVGIISQLSNKSTDFPQRIQAKDRPSGIKCVIMILESPHIDEFNGNPGPAKGRTGKLIRTNFLQVNGLSKYDNYGLILMNAIQHQCSLGFSTKCFRDDVFASAWKNGAKENFINRLDDVFQNDDVLLNCCTKGNTKDDELRQLVQNSMPTNKGVVLKRTHPSSWYSTRNRSYEW